MTDLVKFVTVLLGAILLSSSLRHLDNPFLFARSVDAYGVLPTSLVSWVAGWLPAFQIAIALALILGAWRRTSLMQAAVLFFIFTGIQTYALLSGLRISCGCFGFGSEQVSLFTWAVPATCLILSFGCLPHLSDSNPPLQRSP